MMMNKTQFEYECFEIIYIDCLYHKLNFSFKIENIKKKNKHKLYTRKTFEHKHLFYLFINTNEDCFQQKKTSKSSSEVFVKNCLY